MSDRCRSADALGRGPYANSDWGSAEPEFFLVALGIDYRHSKRSTCHQTKTASPSSWSGIGWGATTRIASKYRIKSLPQCSIDELSAQEDDIATVMDSKAPKNINCLLLVSVTRRPGAVFWSGIDTWVGKNIRFERKYLAKFCSLLESDKNESISGKFGVLLDHLSIVNLTRCQEGSVTGLYRFREKLWFSQESIMRIVPSSVRSCNSDPLWSQKLSEQDRQSLSTCVDGNSVCNPREKRFCIQIHSGSWTNPSKTIARTLCRWKAHF